MAHLLLATVNFKPCIGRKSTKFQMNPMEEVGVAETRSWLAKFKSARAVNPSKIVESKF